MEESFSIDTAAGKHYLSAMFPAYTGIRQYGFMSFLTAGVLFFLLVDAFLLVNFYWTEWITPNQRNVSIAVLFIVWAALKTGESVYLRYLKSIELSEDSDEIFKQATALYLQRNWVAVENILLPYLQKHPRDVEMRLLQATMYRHSNRYEEAAVLLNKLQLLDASKYWMLEIESERAIIVSNENLKHET